MHHIEFGWNTPPASVFVVVLALLIVALVVTGRARARAREARALRTHHRIVEWRVVSCLNAANCTIVALGMATRPEHSFNPPSPVLSLIAYIVLVFSFIGVLGLLTSGVLVRVYRRECVHCGYDQLAGTLCTECGRTSDKLERHEIPRTTRFAISCAAGLTSLILFHTVIPLPFVSDSSGRAGMDLRSLQSVGWQLNGRALNSVWQSLFGWYPQAVNERYSIPLPAPSGVVPSPVLDEYLLTSEGRTYRLWLTNENIWTDEHRPVQKQHEAVLGLLTNTLRDQLSEIDRTKVAESIINMRSCVFGVWAPSSSRIYWTILALLGMLVYGSPGAAMALRQRPTVD